MSTPIGREYLFATETDLGGAERYRTFCMRAGLPETPGGYGMILAEDGDGTRATFVTDDVDYMRLMVSGSESVFGLNGGLRPPAEKFVVREGWPDDWA
ncbi:hypothetical protein ACH4VR_36135 [Streptomyces sp. NPDC020883]|uniref:hypothetical protein n=1 Tax=Streptomyces sp. NPDC020883 TaxID=3365099 RepID=UPI00379E4249